MSWPRFLVEELADRRCVIVAGAGVSASCKADDGSHPPSWNLLLSRLKALIGDTDTKTKVMKLINAEKYLNAAQVIADATVKVDRERVIKSALEMDYRASDWISVIRDLDQRPIPLAPAPRNVVTAAA